MDLAAASGILQSARLRSNRGRKRILPPEDRLAMASRFHAGETVADLAKEYGVSRGTAYAICANAVVVGG